MRAIDRILRLSPFQPAATWINRSRPAVLAFHGIDDPEGFADLMEQVKRQYHPISIDELDGAFYDGTDLPERSVLITFDDGHRSVLDHGLPILESLGLPAVAFVVVGLLSTETDFWWSTVTHLATKGTALKGHETLSAADLVRHLKRVPNDERLRAISEMKHAAQLPPPKNPQLTMKELDTLRRGGIAIGNHTWSHPCLNRCELETTRQEIGRAHSALHSALGEAPRWFAYPNGDWDGDAEKTLIDLDYRLAFLFDHRLADPNADPLRISRLRVNSDTGTDRQSIIVSGLHPAIHRRLGRS